MVDSSPPSALACFSSVLIVWLMFLIALSVRAWATARAKELAMRAAIVLSESCAVIVRKLLSLSAGLVGVTEMWPSSDRASEAGRPSRRAARLATIGVSISVSTSPMSDLDVVLEKALEGIAVACTLIVAFDW